MQTLKDRLSDWWEERKAVMEDGVEEKVLPPADRFVDRVVDWCSTTQQHLKESPWLRGRTRHS